MLAAIAAITSVIIPTLANAQDSPVAWLRFDEAGGTVASDSSGNGNDGTLIGDAVFDLAGGKFGGAVSLDGDGDLVEVLDTDDLEFPQGQDFSITLFYNSGGATSDNNNGLVTKGYGDNPRSPDGYYLLQVTNPSQFSFDSRCCADPTPRVGSGLVGPAITDGAWHNVTVVRDNTAGEIRSYIDGVVESTIVMGAGTDGDWNMGVNSESLQIGDHLNRFTIGKFDDVALWRRTLSDAEITSIVADGVASVIGEVAILFAASPGIVLKGSPTTLSWRVAPGATVTIDQDIGDVTAMTNAAGEGSIEITPTTPTTYTLTADNGIAEQLEARVDIRLIDSFEASTPVVGIGEMLTLSWVVSPTGSVAIDAGIGNVDAQTNGGVGSIGITPSESTTYTLTVTEDGVEETAMVAVNVIVGTEGPIAYWPFDEAEGTTAADMSGSPNEHPAQLIGAIFDPAGGVFGGAVSLDGTDDEVSAADHDDYEFAQGQDFSITLFYNSGGFAANINDGLITKGYADNPRSPEGYYLIQVTASQLVEFDSRCCAGATPRARSGTVGSSITDGEWHNVTFVRDYGAGNSRIYVDGAQVHTATLNPTDGGDWNMGVNNEPLVIGDHFNRFTTGKFDDVAIWRRVLTPDEITAIAADGVAAQLGPGEAFQITEIAYFGDEVSISWPSLPTQTFKIHRSPDMASWEELNDSFNAAPTGEITTYVDDDEVDTFPRMYYRVTRN